MRFWYLADFPFLNEMSWRKDHKISIISSFLLQVNPILWKNLWVWRFPLLYLQCQKRFITATCVAVVKLKPAVWKNDAQYFCKRPYKLHLYRSFLMPGLFQKSKGPLMVSKNVFCRSKCIRQQCRCANLSFQLFSSSTTRNFSRYPKRFISLYLLWNLQGLSREVCK